MRFFLPLPYARLAGCCFFLSWFLLLQEVPSAHAIKTSFFDRDDITTEEQSKPQQREEDVRFNDNPGNFRIWTRLRPESGPVHGLFTPSNGLDGENLQNDEFLTGLRQIQQAVATAERDGERLRAYGQKYSMNRMAYTNGGYQLSTWNLNYCQIGVTNASYVTDPYQSNKDKLVFVQAGVMLKHLHTSLERAGLAVPTTCVPEGPRFVGATVTGSHGSRNLLGSMSDFIKGVHVVVPGGHYFVQRESDPIVTTEYAAYLGNATLLSDDAMFNAIVVSFGSFGIIHGMLFEAEDLQKLRLTVNQFNYEEVKDVISTLNVSKLGIDGVNELPPDFSFYINPFTRDRGGTYTRIYHFVPLVEAEKDAIRNGESVLPATQNSDDSRRVRNGLKFFRDSIGLMVRFVSRVLYGTVLGMVIRYFLVRVQDNGVVGLPSFYQTMPGAVKDLAPIYLSGYIEFEVMVPVDQALEAVELCLEVIDEDMLASPIGVRYVKPTTATLGPARYGELTAIIALVTYDQLPRGRPLFHKIFEKFEERRDTLPHTYHWGKQMPENNYWVERAYGDALTEWQTKRDELLGAVGREMFANQLTEDLGIHV